MSLVPVQTSAPGAFNGSLSASTTLTGVTAHNDILCIAMHADTAGTGPNLSCSDGQVTGWPIDVNAGAGLGVARCTVFHLSDAAAGSHTLTVTASSGTAANSKGEIIAVEVPPVVLDQFNTGGGAGTAVSVGATAALALANELVLAAMLHVNLSTGGGTFPPTGGAGTYTALHHSTANQSDSDYQIQTTTAGIGANWGSITTSGKWAALVATYQPAASAIAGAAAAAASAAAALTTAIQTAGSASAGVTATAALINWTTVTLAGTQYTGPGGIHDPNFWKDVDPPVGTTLYYDASKVTIYPNGEISATTNNCSAVVEFFDGTAWSVGIIIITPQLVSYASVVAAAAGAMTTAITMAGAALGAVSVTGNLTAGIHLAGNALAIAQAAAALTTGIQLNAAALINIAATGALSGGQASLQGNAGVLSQALAQITTHIALAGQVAINSTVAGALAAQIQLNAAAVALTQANAQIQTAIQLSGSANVVSSAAGAALLTTAFAGAANIVSSAMGALLTGLLVAGNALVNSQATADLSTGITLAGGAIVDSAAAFRPPGAEAQFGKAVINVLSPTGLPVARSTFIAGSACIVTIAYYNAQGDAFVPNGVKYSVQDESTGFTLVPATDISNPELSNAITITGNQNTMINLSRNFELHQILFQITDGAGQVNYASAEFELVRTAGVVN